MTRYSKLTTQIFVDWKLDFLSTISRRGLNLFPKNLEVIISMSVLFSKSPKPYQIEPLEHHHRIGLYKLLFAFISAYRSKSKDSPSRAPRAKYISQLNVAIHSNMGFFNELEHATSSTGP